MRERSNHVSKDQCRRNAGGKRHHHQSTAGSVKKVQFDHRDKSLTDIMLLLGYTTEAGILKCFSEKEADDVVCLDEKPADPAALAALPASFIRRNNVFPVCFAKGELVTAFTFPVDLMF
mgnify:CR=1 FL=1